MYTYQICQDSKELLQLQEEWSELFQSMEGKRRPPYLSWSWCFTWWKHFARKGESLFIVVVRKHDRLIGLAPWYRTRFFWKGRTWPLYGFRFLGSGGPCRVDPDYLDFLIRPGEEKAFFQQLLHLLAQWPDWHFLELDDMNELSPHLGHFLQALESAGVSSVQETLEACYYIDFAETGGTYEDFISQLSKNKRYDIGRKTRKLARDHGFIHRIVSEPGEILKSMPSFLALHEERMLDRGLHGAFLHEGFSRFHQEIILELASQGRVQFHFLTLGPKSSLGAGRDVAVLYLLKEGDDFYYYQGGWATSLAAYGLGTVLFGQVLQWGVENGQMRLFDFLRCEEGYKSSWTKKTGMALRLLSFNPWNWKGRLFYHAYQIKGLAWRLFCVREVFFKKL